MKAEALAIWAVLSLPSAGAGPRQATVPPADLCLHGPRRLLARDLLPSTRVVRIRADKKTNKPTLPIKIDFTLPVGDGEETFMVMRKPRPLSFSPLSRAI